MPRTIGLPGRFAICLLLSSTVIAVTVYGWHILGWIFIMTVIVALARSCTNRPGATRTVGCSFDNSHSVECSRAMDDPGPSHLMPGVFLETIDDPCGIFYRDT